MTRDEIRERFRIENPEVTERVMTDAQINSLLIEANINFAVLTRMIVGTVNFSSTIGQDQYDITAEEAKFVDIDEFPGGGVAIGNKRLTMVTKAELDNNNSSWRTNSSGTPTKYFRRGKYIVFDRPPSLSVDIDVDVILLPDRFDDDDKTPFNELTYLEPYHYGLILYLQGKAKMKISKENDKVNAFQEYIDYVNWCKKTLQGGKIGKISFHSADTGTDPYNR